MVKSSDMGSAVQVGCVPFQDSARISPYQGVVRLSYSWHLESARRLTADCALSPQFCRMDGQLRR